MKFTSTAKDNHEGLSDVEFYALVDNMNGDLDALDREDDASSAVILNNLHSLEALIGCTTEDFVKDFCASNEDLASMYNGDLEAFKKSVHDEIVSMEGAIDEWFGDGIIKALVGRKMTTLEYLKPALDECEQRLAQCDEKKIESRAKIWIFGRVISRFLPSTDAYYKNIAALEKAAGVVKSFSSLDKFEALKVMDALKDSTYWNAAKGKLKGQSDTDWAYVAIRSLPAIPYVGFAAGIHNAFFWDPDKPVSTRGWKSKADFENGIKEARKLIKIMEETDAACKKLLGNAQPELKKQGHEAASVCKFIVAECGHLGRGIVTAAKKVTSGFFGRVGRNIVHA